MKHTSPYGRLTVMFILHLIAMYVLMYAMVDTFANIHHNYNQLYMATLMAASMVILELLLMKSMYPSAKLNFIVLVVGIGLLAGSFVFIRQQAAIADEQLLKSMIPHHAGAILMCEEALLEDPQIRQLCDNIISGQQAEIEWMDQKLQSLER